MKARFLIAAAALLFVAVGCSASADPSVDQGSEAVASDGTDGTDVAESTENLSGIRHTAKRIVWYTSNGRNVYGACRVNLYIGKNCCSRNGRNAQRECLMQEYSDDNWGWDCQWRCDQKKN
jgi:hypothetical protein